MESIENKVLNIENIKSSLDTDKVFMDKTIQHEISIIKSLIPYDKIKTFDNIFLQIKSCHEKQLLKTYELGLIDGIKLSYEIKEKI